MFKRLIALLTLSLIGCGGGGQNPIPTGTEIQYISGNWIAVQTDCQQITAIGSGLTTGGTDTIYYFRRSALSIDKDHPTEAIDMIYDIYENVGCNGPLAGQTMDHYKADWVPTQSTISSASAVKLTYVGTIAWEFLIDHVYFSAPKDLKVLIAPHEGQLYWYEGGSGSEVDASSYPTGVKPVSAIYAKGE
jgi:hypothetical protein